MSCAIIDVQLGIERVYGAADIWHRAITMLMAELPGVLADIESAFAEGRHEDLQSHAHRLHGASIYCGTPMLQIAARMLELGPRAPCYYSPMKRYNFNKPSDVFRRIALATDIPPGGAR